MSKTYTVTRDDIVEVFRRWETDVRLNPGSFLPREKVVLESVENVAHGSADEFLETLREMRG